MISRAMEAASSSGSARWSFNVSKWVPTKQEWCAAMRRVQVEDGERKRIREFR